MRSKAVDEVKEAIVRLKKQNKHIREMIETLGLAKSAIWYILKTKAQQLQRVWKTMEDG